LPVGEVGGEARSEDASAVMGSNLAFELPELEGLRFRWFNAFLSFFYCIIPMS
jgi:hypothetical protein